MFLIAVLSFARQWFTSPIWLYAIAPLRVPAFCAAINCWQNDPSDGSKKLTMPTLMSCRSAPAQNHSRFFRIGPPYSPEMTSIFLTGLPDRNPFCPALNCASETFCACIVSFENVPVTEPLNTLLPLFVTRLIDIPLDCTETSPPPVVTWI